MIRLSVIRTITGNDCDRQDDGDSSTLCDTSLTLPTTRDPANKKSALGDVTTHHSTNSDITTVRTTTSEKVFQHELAVLDADIARLQLQFSIAH